MPSVVDICNEAMDLLGAATITALTENSKEARLCNRRFSTVRDATLRSHSWNCAIARADEIERMRKAEAMKKMVKARLKTKDKQ